jgi:hypothetical protein
MMGVLCWWVRLSVPMKKHYFVRLSVALSIIYIIYSHLYGPNAIHYFSINGQVLLYQLLLAKGQKLNELSDRRTIVT